MHQICLCHAFSVPTCYLVLHTFAVQHISVLFDWPVCPACCGCAQHHCVLLVAASMPATKVFALNHALQQAQGCTALHDQLHRGWELTAHVKQRHGRQHADSAHMRDAKSSV